MPTKFRLPEADYADDLRALRNSSWGCAQVYVVHFSVHKAVRRTGPNELVACSQSDTCATPSLMSSLAPFMKSRFPRFMFDPKTGAVSQASECHFLEAL